MQQGIGIRYSPNGIRVAVLEKTEDGLKIEGAVAGIPSRGIKTFLEENGFPSENVSVTVGLCPGEFLSSCISGTANMAEDEIAGLLNWEIKRKIISGVSEYSMDYLNLGNTAILFASQNKIISAVKDELPESIIDVEPIALFNSWDNSGEKTADPVMIICLEAEGISSVTIDKFLPVSIESFVIREEEVSRVISDLDYDGLFGVQKDVQDRYMNYMIESIMRMTALGEDKSKITPSRILLTGAGAPFGKFAKRLSDTFKIDTAVFDPFGETVKGLDTLRHEFQELRSAFSSPIGFAMRAIAENL